MQQIRISSTGKIRQALDTLRSYCYPLLSDAEIVKVVLSQAVTKRIADECLFVEKLDKKTSGSLIRSRKQIKKKNYQTAAGSKELLAKLNK